MSDYSDFLQSMNSAQNAVNSLAVTATNNKSYKQSKKLMNFNFGLWKQQQQIVNDISRQNTLDAAKLQKQGYINAGLNPALMNQTATQLAGASVAGSLPSSQFQQQAPFFDFAEFAMQSKLAQADIDLKKAQEHKAQSEASGQDITNSNLNEVIKLQMANLDITNSNLTQEGKNLIQQLQNMKSSNELTIEQKNLILKDIDLKGQEIEQLQTSNSFLAEQLTWTIANLKQQNQLTIAECKQAYAAAANLYASAKRTENALNLDNAQKAVFEAESARITKQTSYDEFERNITRSLGNDWLKDAKKQEYLRNWYQNYHDFHTAKGPVGALASAVASDFNNTISSGNSAPN